MNAVKLLKKILLPIKSQTKGKLHAFLFLFKKRKALKSLSETNAYYNNTSILTGIPLLNRFSKTPVYLIITNPR